MNAVPATRVDVERNRRILLDAAAVALALDPDATLGDVARRAGLARATLYRHFSNRESLLDALRDDAVECAREVVDGAQVGYGTALEALRRVVEGIVSLGARFRPLLLEGAAQDPEFLRRREEAFMPVAMIVQRGQRAGHIRADISVLWIVTALMALLAAAVRLEGKLSEEEIVELVFGTLSCGVQETPSAEN
ncbi:TetR/AcrR family transcriptional regulator [Salinibacterium sp. UTAS2018]|uniref:TetR/AcrR family transcriptional regulator n=1 Tax=Salinibacterium sp. UTAS2018 TaxID=2508880 RepID=UPI0010094C6B|nr:TetR/AcrR family transcriptional regulator [Salinibacterium sp. UTAS2018]QAV70995.1 TetR/AcrR family transcriptional regulator [Salinibacterium sp. UTAS2018]